MFATKTNSCIMPGHYGTGQYEMVYNSSNTPVRIVTSSNTPVRIVGSVPSYTSYVSTKLTEPENDDSVKPTSLLEQEVQPDFDTSLEQNELSNSTISESEPLKPVETPVETPVEDSNFDVNTSTLSNMLPVQNDQTPYEFIKKIVNMLRDITINRDVLMPNLQMMLLDLYIKPEQRSLFDKICACKTCSKIIRKLHEDVNNHLGGVRTITTNTLLITIVDSARSGAFENQSNTNTY